MVTSNSCCLVPCRSITRHFRIAVIDERRRRFKQQSQLWWLERVGQGVCLHPPHEQPCRGQQR
ncbi:MAG: hypothetical protein ACPIOQ_53900, partial [Promethearchaeia archaeon]